MTLSRFSEIAVVITIVFVFRIDILGMSHELLPVIVSGRHYSSS